MYILRTVYYEIANNQPLMDISREARVYPAPNTLYAHLRIVCHFRKRTEEQSKSIPDIAGNAERL